MFEEKELKSCYKSTFDKIVLDEKLASKIIQREFLHSQRRFHPYVAVLLIMFVFGSATTALAFAKQLPFFDLFSTSSESGYKIWVDIEKNDNEQLDGEIVEVKEIVQRRQSQYEPYMSWYPLEYEKHFDTLSNSFEYVGTNFSYVLPAGDLPATLNVYCNNKGDIETVKIMSEFEYKGSNVQLWYYIFTDLAKEPGEKLFNASEYDDNIITNSNNMIFKVVDAEKNMYQICSETTGTGMNVPVIISGVNQNNVETAESYFTFDKITYSINVSSDPENLYSAEETLRDLLQLF